MRNGKSHSSFNPTSCGCEMVRARKSLQGKGKIREFYSEFEKIDILKRSQVKFIFPKSFENIDVFILYTSFFSKAALKHADSQGMIEKMEQEMARLKLKHSLEVKVRHEEQFHQYSSTILLKHLLF